MTAKRLSRRTMLRASGACLALPLLEAMALPNRSVMAMAPAGKLRMGFFYVPNGKHMPDWTPSEEGPKYLFPKTLEALAPFRDKVSVLTGLTLDGARAHGDGGGDHARSGAAFLTGAHPRKTDGADIQNGVSVDQVAAQAIGGENRFASLELGLEGSAQSGNCDSGYSCAYSSNLSWRNSTSPLAKEMNPAALFERLFGANQGSGDAGASGSSNNNAQRYRRSILDSVLEEANGLKRSLGQSDQRKLDEYMYSVREIENRLGRSDLIIGVEGGKVDYARPAGVPKELDEHCRLMLDLYTLALQTDSTRVISFMFANEGSNRAYTQVEISEGHHELSHHGKSQEKQDKIAKINRYHVSKLAYLLSRLDAVVEGERTLLDNCLLVYGSGISDGDRHNHDDLPILMCGRGGGGIREAAHRKYAKETPLCNLYLWMLHEMGVKTDSFGDSTGEVKLG
jgi:hypothetical protein